MSFITVGNISINADWAAFLLALLLYVVIEKLVKWSQSAWFEDVVFTYILVWKFSYIVIEFPLFLENPLSALYFSGGVMGHILGVIVAVWLLMWKTKKNNEKLQWRHWLFTFTGFYLVWQGCSFVLAKEFVIGIIVIGLYLFIIYRMRKKESTFYMYMLILLNSMLLAYEQQLISIKGWIFIGVTLFALSFLLRKEMKNIVSTVVLVVLLCATMSNLAEKQEQQVASGEVVDFELQTLSGETVRLSDYKGKKVILNFWATWCPPCKAEMPHMQNYYEHHNDEVEIIAINLTSRDNGVDKVQSFIESYGLTFPIPLDVDGVYGKQYEVTTIPTTYIVNTKGEVVQKIVGPMDERMIKRIVKDIE